MVLPVLDFYFGLTIRKINQLHCLEYSAKEGEISCGISTIWYVMVYITDNQIHFSFANSSECQNQVQPSTLSILPYWFCGTRYWGPEILSDLPQVTQNLSGRAWINVSWFLGWLFFPILLFFNHTCWFLNQGEEKHLYESLILT